MSRAAKGGTGKNREGKTFRACGSCAAVFIAYMELFAWCSHFKNLSLPVTSATECRRRMSNLVHPMKASFTLKVRNYANQQGAALRAPAPLFTALTNAQQQCLYLPSRIPPKSDIRCANCEPTVVCAPKRRAAVTAPFAQNSPSFVGQILFILGEKCIKYVQISCAVRRLEGRGCHQYRLYNFAKKTR